MANRFKGCRRIVWVFPGPAPLKAIVTEMRKNPALKMYLTNDDSTFELIMAPDKGTALAFARTGKHHPEQVTVEVWKDEEYPYG